MGWMDLGTGFGPSNMSELNEMIFGKEASIKKEKVVDPKKTAVASPLSNFLAQNVGTGIPRFEGNIYGELPEGGGSSISEFLKMDTDEYFNKFVQEPAVGTFKDELLPLLQEDFAGSLSGSGRLRAETDAARGLSRDLAIQRGEFGLKLPAAQLQVASAIKEHSDKEAQAQYNDWMKSLPQYNPILDKALSFLNETTSSGTTLLSFLDEGSNGILGDVLKTIAAFAG